MNRTLFTCFAILVGGTVLLASRYVNDTAGEGRNGRAAVTAETEPVEPNMHEFMEYYFQSPFRRLERAMRKPPEETRAWKEIKSDTLILAESGNLLLGRTEENVEAWDKHSIAVRETGREMYKATLESDFETAKVHFQSMVDNCNACHDQFADGKHQQRVR